MASRRSSERLGSPRARLFIALDLPADAREELVRWRAAAFAGRSDLRLLDPAALHVTLIFLGYTAEKQIPAIVAAMRLPPEGVEAPVLTATGVKPVPPRRPRLFALDLEDEEARATAVQASLSGALEGAGLYKPEKRAFWPHITLARVKRGTLARAVDAPAPPADPWRAQALTLYRSTLRPQGARYDALERIPL